MPQAVSLHAPETTPYPVASQDTLFSFRTQVLMLDGQVWIIAALDDKCCVAPPQSSCSKHPRLARTIAAPVATNPGPLASIAWPSVRGCSLCYWLSWALEHVEQVQTLQLEHRPLDPVSPVDQHLYRLVCLINTTLVDLVLWLDWRVCMVASVLQLWSMCVWAVPCAWSHALLLMCTRALPQVTSSPEPDH